MTQTVVGVFDSTDAARAAEETLIREGVDRTALHINQASAATGRTELESQESEGIMSGIRHFFSDLFGGSESSEAGYYSEAIRRGAVVLAVDLPDDARVEPVRDALERAGAIDIEERAEQWRKQGWTGYDPQARLYTAEEAAQERSNVIPVVEEQLEVGKRQVRKGAVRVVARTVETPVREEVSLREEHATIERRPVDRPASPAELANLGDKTIEVEETAEKAVVNKSARVVEEVVVDKNVSQRTETIEDTVRHTEVQTDRSGGEAETRMVAYEEYEPLYRQDFQTRYAAEGARYEDYAPAYRYGHTLGCDVSYQNRQWNEIEPQLRADWQREHPESAWDRAKLAVQHGWERARTRR